MLKVSPPGRRNGALRFERDTGSTFKQQTSTLPPLPFALGDCEHCPAKNPECSVSAYVRMQSQSSHEYGVQNHEDPPSPFWLARLDDFIRPKGSTLSPPPPLCHPPGSSTLDTPSPLPRGGCHHSKRVDPHDHIVW